ncbi:MAG: hypothetical protein V1854_00990 [Methanobacteriota archaeon]
MMSEINVNMSVSIPDEIYEKFLIELVQREYRYHPACLGVVIVEDKCSRS